MEPKTTREGPGEGQDQRQESSPADNAQARYRCSVCGYIYDPAAEGASFDQAPDDWKCPVCMAGKDAFEPV